MIKKFPEYILFLGIVLALLAFYIGGDSFLDNLLIFGKSRNISNINTGLFLVSFGTVIDEAAVVIFATIELHGDVSFGTIQGSNVFTLILTVILVAISGRLISKKFMTDLAIFLAASLILVFVGVFFRTAPWYIGLIFILMFLGYTQISRRRKVTKVTEGTWKTDSLSIIMSLILIGTASYAVVDYVSSLSVSFHIGYFASSFIIIGVAGSLPEIFTIILSMRKKIWQMTIGIAIGSSIYKGVLFLGITFLFSRVDVASGLYSLYAVISLILILMVFTLPAKGKKMDETGIKE
ncbi:MAG: hypothetical protein LVQ96_05675 [Thermoplasmatales archaeon]|nr:hypothetical protein [Thermoplasmatales archaeon]MCW6170642.1 hypothetical protein [Thermoplasmatales archaeon]